MFKPLADYLKASQQEWLSFVQFDNDMEQGRQTEYEIGLQEMESGQYEQAISHFKKATSSKKYRKEAYYQLAECYQQLNMIPLARKTYERLMRFDYNYRDVQERLRALDAPGQTVASTRQPSQARISAPGKDTATSVMSAAERYNVLETLHEGRYSRIYLARDNLLGRTIALKQIDAHYPDRITYFQQMKERTALDHPNILRIYDIDEQQGQISMEYVEGQDLRYTMRLKGALTPQMTIYLAIQLVNGIYHAHSRGIIHHALTPEHILLTRQCHLKITAFRAPDSFMQFQKTDDPYKYLYVPPERFSDAPLTEASNIYSFGVILYEMFIGHPPFALQQVKAFVRHKHPLQYDESPLPPELRPLIKRCLQTAPEQRFPTIRTIGEQLIAWYKNYERKEAHEDEIAAYKDYLLMAWADGKISPEEAVFLAHKRQELQITDPETQQAEQEVKQELKALLGGVA